MKLALPFIVYCVGYLSAILQIEPIESASSKGFVIGAFSTVISAVVALFLYIKFLHNEAQKRNEKHTETYVSLIKETNKVIEGNTSAIQDVRNITKENKETAEKMRELLRDVLTKINK